MLQLIAVLVMLLSGLAVTINEYLNKEIPRERIIRETVLNAVLANGIGALMFLLIERNNSEMWGMMCIFLSSGDCSVFAGNLYVEYLALCLFSVVILLCFKYYNHHKVNTSAREIEIADKPGIIVLFVLALCLVYLHFQRMNYGVYWGDEGFTIRLARMQVQEMIVATASDVHPPLYYLLVRLCYLFFGNHDWVYHLMSFIPYAGMMLICLTMVRKRFGVASAGIMMLCVSLMQDSVVYVQEVRMYELAGFFTLMSAIKLYDIIETGRNRDYCWFVIVTVAAAYTHYYAFLSVALLHLGLLIYCIKHQAMKKRVLLTAGASILLYAPWLIVFFSTFSRVSNDWWPVQYPSVLRCLLTLFSISSTLTLLPFALVVIIVPLFASSSRLDSKFKDWIFMCLLSVIGLICVGVGISRLMRPMFMVRYLYPVSVISWLLFSVLLNRLPQYSKSSACIVAMIMMLVGIPLVVKTTREEAEMDARIKHTIKEMEEFDDVSLILTDNYHLDWTILDVYFPNCNHQLVTVDDLGQINVESDFWYLSMNRIDQNCIEKRDEVVEEVCGNGEVGVDLFHIYHFAK